MRLIKNLFFAFSFLVSTFSLAQYNETIRADRPGISITPFTPGKGVLQIQSGFDYAKSKEKSTSDQTEVFLNSTQFRYGFMEKLEFNSYWVYQSNTMVENSFESKADGFSEISLGLRYLMIQGRGARPSVSTQVGFNLPVLSEDFAISNAAPRILLATTQNLTRSLTMTTNWSLIWKGNGDNQPNFIHTLNFAFPLSDKVGAFIEYYGIYVNNVAPVSSPYEPRVDGGVGWLLTRNLQLDLHGGIGSSHGTSDFFISTGVSWKSK
ncbi:MAG: transporter [Flammeovirgaceae bacterium]|nr:transporter [Flammeovirgaceae bacterium]